MESRKSSMGKRLKEKPLEKFNGKTYVVSHHPKDFKIAVGASIWNVYGRDENAFFIDSNRFQQSLRKVPRIDRGDRIIVNGYGSMLKSAVLLLLLSPRGKTCQIVLFWHETAWNLLEIRKSFLFGATSDAILKLFLHYNKGLINWCASPIGPQVLSSRYGLPLERFKFVGNALFEELPKRRFGESSKKTSSKFSVIGAGILNSRKGVDRFFQLADISPRSVGDRKLTFTWFAPQHPGEKRKNVKISSTENFIQEVRKHDLLIISSRDDPNPVVAIEAMAQGIPVLCLPGASTPMLSEKVLTANNLRRASERIVSLASNTEEIPNPEELRAVAEEYTTEAFVRRAWSTKTPNPISRERKYSALGLRRFAYRMLLRAKLVLFTIIVDTSRFLISTKNKSIVIVGSSPNLLNRGLGAEIDRFEEVVRLTSTDFQNLEPDLGTRTTRFYFTAAIKTKLVQQQNFLKLICVPNGPYRSLRQVINRIEQGPSAGLREFKILRRSPLHTVIIGVLYPRKFKHWASTGMEAILREIFSSHSLNSISIVGFDLLGLSKSKEIAHSQVASTINDGRHDFLLEHNAVQILIARNLIEEL